jgi:hypothetical protein
MDSTSIPTVSYFLVLLRTGPNQAGVEADWEGHVAFVDSLVQENLVLLGGDLVPPLGDAAGAYLLHTRDRSEAEACARRDPLVRHGRVIPEVIEWRLVGINPRAIDPAVNTSAP